VEIVGPVASEALGGIITRSKIRGKCAPNGSDFELRHAVFVARVASFLRARTKARHKLSSAFCAWAGPLCAGYRTDVAWRTRAAFESGVRKVTLGLQHVTTEVLDEAQWKRFDSAGRLFWNMNTLADYEASRLKMGTRERSSARSGTGQLF
jgi:hypothetical protein